MISDVSSREDNAGRQSMDFGEYLKSKRCAKGWSINRLALYSGCSDSYLSQLERGERQAPSERFLRKLAKPLGVPYEVLLEEAGHLQDGTGRTENRTMIQLIQESLGDSKEQFVARLGLTFDEVELLERGAVATESVEVVLDKLFASQRLLTARQKLLLDKLESLFCEPSELEYAHLLEKFLWTVLDGR